MRRFVNWNLVSFAFFISVSFSAFGGNPSEADVSANKTDQGQCAFLTGVSQTNCLKFLSDPDIPKDALVWSLGVLRDNSHGLRMNQCLLEPSKDHYSNLADGSDRQVVTRETLRDGIKNQCQMMINDTRKPWPGGSKWQGTYYFLDLCTGKKRTGYFNMGKGTKLGKSYPNESGKKSTVLGAFLSSSETFSYNGSDSKKGKRKYNALRKQYGRVAAVSLFGLQNTNNGSDRDKKYMHVSPFSSSWGCPSLNPKDYGLIDTLAKEGPSLVVNYGPKEFMEDPKKCTAEAPPRARFPARPAVQGVQ